MGRCITIETSGAANFLPRAFTRICPHRNLPAVSARELPSTLQVGANNSASQAKGDPLELNVNEEILIDSSIGRRPLVTREKATREGRNESGASAPESDLYLFARICEGDRAAFEQLYCLYQPRLTRFLQTLTGRPTIVEEVLNDTMMVVWNRPDSFHGASKLSTWIYAIAYRKAMKGLRQQDEAVEDKDADHRVSSEAGPEDTSGRIRVHRMLMRAMGELTAAHRAVVELTYFHGLGYREIADILECPVDTVKTRMFHARRHLRKHLGGGLADWI